VISVLDFLIAIIVMLQYYTAKANMTSSVSTDYLWPYRSDTAKTGPILMLVSVSLHHYFSVQ